MTSATVAWMASLNDVLTDGVTISPRGMETKEIIGSQISFDMNYPVCYHQERKLSYTFMAAEAYWITSGSMFVDDIAPYNKHIAQFSDDQYIFNGAYGPKFINQLDYVVNSLIRDQMTRQAVFTIWVPNPIRTKDYACTISMQFLIRDGKINTIVNMRSNDLWLGRPYDMFNFTVMTLRVLTYLNENASKTFGEFVKLGTLYLNVGSSHLYANNFEKANRVLLTPMDKFLNPIPLQALTDWQFVVDSLLACRDNQYEERLWRIRP